MKGAIRSGMTHRRGTRGDGWSRLSWSRRSPQRPRRATPSASTNRAAAPAPAPHLPVRLQDRAALGPGALQVPRQRVRDSCRTRSPIERRRPGCRPCLADPNRAGPPRDRGPIIAAGGGSCPRTGPAGSADRRSAIRRHGARRHRGSDRRRSRDRSRTTPRSRATPSPFSRRRKCGRAVTSCSCECRTSPATSLRGGKCVASVGSAVIRNGLVPAGNAMTARMRQFTPLLAGDFVVLCRVVEELAAHEAARRRGCKKPRPPELRGRILPETPEFVVDGRACLPRPSTPPPCRRTRSASRAGTASVPPRPW